MNINIKSLYFISYYFSFFLVIKLNIITSKVWFKFENFTDNWTRVSLKKVKYIDDFKKKIKIEMAIKLDTFTLSSLTLKATYNNINSNEVVELRKKDRLILS
jgi:hypothetical protein